MQIVELLIQCGSKVSDMDLRGLSALDIAKEENIKELLQASSVMHEQPFEVLEKYRQTGELPSTIHT